MHQRALEFIGRLSAIRPKHSLSKEIKRRSEIGPNYLIFFTARSGSSWLTELLTINGALGRPEEWFNPSLSHGSAAHFGTRNVFDYVEATYWLARDPVTSVFGAEVTYAQLDVFNQMVNLFAFFPPRRTIFFCLRREDILKQSISLYRMVAGGQAHSNEAASTSHIPYDANEIARWMKHIWVQEIGMERMFEDFGITTHYLSYESMMRRDPMDVLQFFHQNILGQRFDGDFRNPEKHSKLKNTEAEDWYERFSSEMGGYLEETLASRPPVLSAF